jgi:hypothetical protein
MKLSISNSQSTCTEATDTDRLPLRLCYCYSLKRPQDTCLGERLFPLSFHPSSCLHDASLQCNSITLIISLIYEVH